MQERSEIGFCEHHNEVVNLSMFEWKGCWSCHYFREENFPFIDVTEAADILGVLRSTIIPGFEMERLTGVSLREEEGYRFYRHRIKNTSLQRNPLKN
jgi:hypothetical protein